MQRNHRTQQTTGTLRVPPAPSWPRDAARGVLLRHTQCVCYSSKRIYSRNRRGLSLLELLAVVAIIGVIASVVVPRIRGSKQVSQGTSCSVHVGVIEVQASLWRFQTGVWPDAALTNVGADKSFFPEGLPTCPLDGSAYTIDTATGHVIGHEH